MKEVHEKKKSHKCNFCSLTFTRPWSMRIHVKRIHEKGPLNYKCVFCEKSFMNNHHTQQHIRKVHAPGVIEPGDLKSSLKKFRCDLCEKTYTGYTQLQCHLKAHIGDKKVQCNKCLKLFVTKYDLKHHEKLVHELEKVQCNVCEKSFQNDYGLNFHVKIIHQGERKYFPCSLCSKTFERNNQLTEHLRIFHEKRRDYKCSDCGKEFATKQRLNVHSKAVHKSSKNENDDPFDVTSDETNPSQEIANNSENAITQEDHFPDDHNIDELVSKESNSKSDLKCSICDKTLESEGKLASHMKKHYKLLKKSGKGKKVKKSGQCSICDKMQRDLLTHIRNVHYQLHHCDECGKSFNKYDHLIKHQN